MPRFSPFCPELSTKLVIRKLMSRKSIVHCRACWYLITFWQRGGRNFPCCYFKSSQNRGKELDSNVLYFTAWGPGLAKHTGTFQAAAKIVRFLRSSAFEQGISCGSESEGDLGVPETQRNCEKKGTEAERGCRHRVTGGLSAKNHYWCTVLPLFDHLLEHKTTTKKFECWVF